MLVMHGLPADAQGPGDLAPRPPEPARVLDLNVLQLVKAIADSAWPGCSSLAASAARSTTLRATAKP
jgi:hypothetical protein